MEHKYIIADHSRAILMIVNDGVYPAAKGRGYILRRLIRRVLRSSLALGIDINNDQYFVDLVNSVVGIYDGVYDFDQEVVNKVLEVIKSECIKYQKAITTGKKEWQKILAKQPSTSTLPQFSFDLYQSHGVPLELSESILEDNGLKYDSLALNNLIVKHQEISNTTLKGDFKSGLVGNSPKTMALHTVTHILHKTLKDLYGSDVRQMGSSITEEKARFDFSVNQVVDLALVQTHLNKIISLDLFMTMQETTPNKAKMEGAIGLFGEKYGAKVTVYTLSDSNGIVYSKEFCTGPHVNSTAQIKSVTLLKQKNLGSGVKRIEFGVVI
jgi:alanyl-tRNA synthetase